MTETRPDIVNFTLTLAIVGVLFFFSFTILAPFLPACVWAMTIVVATWPLLVRLQSILRGSRTLAVLVTSVVVMLVFVVPCWLATATILSHAGELFGLARAAGSFRVPAAPHWVASLPLVGAGIAHAWQDARDSGLSELAPRIAPYAGRATRWFVGFLGGFGLLVVQFLLTVVITAILHANGEAASGLAMRAAHRLAGDRGRLMVVLAGHAIRAVAIGVMVTALVESLVGGLGLWLAGVPLASVLTAVMFVVCLAQIGPGLVLIPAVIWMYWSADGAHATELLVVSVVAITIDNVLRPLLIRRSAELPMLLVLVGVIGGLSAFGLVGIFIGPAVLAVSYTVLQAWLAEDPVALAASSVGTTTAKPRDERPHRENTQCNV